jgi:hypothetical protein
VVPALIALAPSVGIGFLFYLVIKAMIEGDRRERTATAKWEQEHGIARRGAPDGTAAAPDVVAEPPAPSPEKTRPV